MELETNNNIIHEKPTKLNKSVKKNASIGGKSVPAQNALKHPSTVRNGGKRDVPMSGNRVLTKRPQPSIASSGGPTRRVDQAASQADPLRRKPIRKSDVRLHWKNVIVFFLVFVYVLNDSFLLSAYLAWYSQFGINDPNVLSFTIDGVSFIEELSFYYFTKTTQKHLSSEIKSNTTPFTTARIFKRLRWVNCTPYLRSKSSTTRPSHNQTIESVSNSYPPKQTTTAVNCWYQLATYRYSPAFDCIYGTDILFPHNWTTTTRHR